MSPPSPKLCKRNTRLLKEPGEGPLQQAGRGKGLRARQLQVSGTFVGGQAPGYSGP